MTTVMPAPQLLRTPTFHRHWPWAALSLVLTAFIALLATYYAPAMSEPDDNGYFAQGIMLARHGRTWFAPESDAQYAGMHWLLSAGRTYVCRYSVGLPALIAALSFLGGWQASYLANPILAVLALIGFFFLARQFISAGWAVLGVFLLAINAMFVHHALAGDSHMAVTCALIWGLYFLIRWSRTPSFALAFLAAAILGCIPAVRYPDAVMGLGMLVYLACYWRHFKNHPSHLIAMILGVALPIVPLLIHNHFVYGAFWHTGYSLSNESTAFSLAYFLQHAESYLHNMLGESIGLMFALGLIGMVYMILADRDSDAPINLRASGWLLLLLVLPMLLLYMAYYWAPGNATMALRFLLPTYAIYLLAGLILIRQLCQLIPVRRQAWIAVAILIFQTAWGLPQTLALAAQLHNQKEPLVRATQFLEQNVPEGSLVIASSQFLAQFDFVQKWKLADPDILTGRAGGPGGVGGMGGPGGMPGFDGMMFGQRNANPFTRANARAQNNMIDNDFSALAAAMPSPANEPVNEKLVEKMRRRAQALRTGTPLPADLTTPTTSPRAPITTTTSTTPINRANTASRTTPSPALADRPSPMQQDKLRELRQRYTGTTEEKQKKFLADVRTWASLTGKIYILGTESQLQQWEELGTVKIQKLADMTLYTPDQLAARTTRRANMMSAPGGFGGGGMPGPMPGAPNGGGAMPGMGGPMNGPIGGMNGGMPGGGISMMPTDTKLYLAELIPQ